MNVVIATISYNIEKKCFYFRQYEKTPNTHIITNTVKGRKIVIEKDNLPDTGL